MSVGHAPAFTYCRQHHIDGVTWPVPRSALTTLADLGMSVPEIARYFAVDPAAVRIGLWPVRDR